MMGESKLHIQPIQLAFVSQEKTVYFTFDPTDMAVAFEQFLRSNGVKYEKMETSHVDRDAT